MDKKETISFFQLKQRKGTIIVITAVFLFISLILTLIQPLKYSASTSLLVIQKGDVGIDVYTASRSAQQVAETLSRLVYTSSFFYKVMDAGFDVSENMFSSEENKRRRQWARTVETSVRNNTGILEITVYDENRYTASELAGSIAYVLTIQGHEYIGRENVEIKIVDNVLVSKYPVKPNILINGLIGLLTGFVISISYVLLQKEKKQKKEEKTVKEVMEKPAQSAYEQTAPEVERYEKYPEEELEVMPKEK